MSSDTSPQVSVEQRGLLHSTSLDMINFELAERHNQHPNGSGDDWYRSRKAWKTLPVWLRPRILFIALALVFGFIFVGAGWYRKPEIIVAEKVFKSVQASDAKVEKWEKPNGFKIIGLVFFGRPSVVAVLDCYLKKNLVSNGGFLDEVHWVVNTGIVEDIHYLDRLVKTSERYKKIIIPSLGFNSIWEHAVEREHMYIKIDDDMVCEVVLISPFYR